MSRQGPAATKTQATGDTRRSVRVGSMLSRRSGAGNSTLVKSEFVFLTGLKGPCRESLREDATTAHDAKRQACTHTRNTRPPVTHRPVCSWATSRRALCENPLYERVVVLLQLLAHGAHLYKVCVCVCVSVCVRARVRVSQTRSRIYSIYAVSRIMQRTLPHASSGAIDSSGSATNSSRNLPAHHVHVSE